MLNWIIDWSLRFRLIVALATIVFVGFGVGIIHSINVDAFPDTTPVQVQINAVAPGLAPEEVERQLTFPVEQTLAGLPRVEQMRSTTRFGLGQVVVNFQDGTDIYFAQLVSERLGALELPEGRPRPKMGPVATGLGEVFHYRLRSATRNLVDLRTAQDWVLRPALRTRPRHGRDQFLGRPGERIPGARRSRSAHQTRRDLRAGGAGNLGIYLQKHGQMREAAAQYEAPVELTSDPGLLAQTYANRGAAHRALGDDKKSY